MKPSEYLDALRAKLELPSDYALQNPLGVTRAALSKYRHNKIFFDETVCHRVAELLGKHPGFVMLDMQRERAKRPEDQAVWQEIYKGFLLLLPRAKGAGFA